MGEVPLAVQLRTFLLAPVTPCRRSARAFRPPVHWLAERSSVSSGATGVERTAVDGAGLTPAAAPQLHAELGELAGDDGAFDHDQAAAVAEALAALFPLGSG